MFVCFFSASLLFYVLAYKKWHASPIEESFDESEEEEGKSAYTLELAEDDQSSHTSNIR